MRQLLVTQNMSGRGNFLRLYISFILSYLAALVNYKLNHSLNIMHLQVHKCVGNGGKVLIPTFALGRAQELCILLDDYWERMNLKVPIYFSSGLTMQANLYYKVLINWTSQKVKDTYATRNAFDFKNVHTFDRSLLDAPGPCVLFATPGMISGGFSLEAFKHWAPSDANLITLPGYCVAGTVGHKLTSGNQKPEKVYLDKDTQIDVRCQIHQLSFSPHTDAKGIMDLVKFLSPKNVILVHGEKPKMEKLKGRIELELGIQCYHPANTETVSFPSTHFVKSDVTNTFIRSSLIPNFKFSNVEVTEMSPIKVHDDRVAEGILTMVQGQKVKIVQQDEFLTMVGTEKTDVEFAYCFALDFGGLKSCLPTSEEIPVSDDNNLLGLLNSKLSNEVAEFSMQDSLGTIQVNSFRLAICNDDNCPHRTNDDESIVSSECKFFCCTWSIVDKNLAWRVISLMKNMSSSVDTVMAD